MAVISSDQITLVNVSDAYSVTLSRETYIFIGNGDGVPAGKKCTTEVTAYRGKDQCSAITITEKQITCPTGISATVSGNGTSKVTVTFTTTATITPPCEASIPITVEGNSFTKQFTFSWIQDPEELESRLSKAETSISNNADAIKLKASQEVVTKLSDDYKLYTKNTTEFIQTAKGWQLNWEKLISTDDADVKNHQDYITFDNGDIILGESSSDLKVKITNDSIQFKGTSDTEVTPDSDATAWITGKTFHISDGEIQNSLKFGDLYLTPTSNGSLAFGANGNFGSIAEIGETVRIGTDVVTGTKVLITKDNFEICPSGSLADALGYKGRFKISYDAKHVGTSDIDESYISPHMILGNPSDTKGGPFSIAIGYSSVCGRCSIGLGDAEVNGDNTIALGIGSKSDNDNQLIVGKYNIAGDYPLIIGNGAYPNRSNALTVDWDGNIVAPKLTSPGDLKLGFENGNAFKPYFTKGDTTTVTVYLQGRIVTKGKEILFYMPFSRPIIGATGVSVSSVNGIAVSQNGKSLYGSSSYVKPNAYSASIIGDGHGVNIRATMPNTTNATNNATCAITASIKITFS